MAKTFFYETLKAASRYEAAYEFQDALLMDHKGQKFLGVALRASSLQKNVFLIGKNSTINFQLGQVTLSMHPHEEHFGEDVKNARVFFGEPIAITDASLRRTFTFLEYVVFFLSKHPAYSQDQNYDEKSETYAERLKKLKERNIITKNSFEDLRSLKDTRDQFAHSFVQLHFLTFRGVPIGSRSCEFSDVLVKTSKTLESLFLQNQHLQVNWKIFFLVFEELMKTRTA